MTVTIRVWYGVLKNKLRTFCRLTFESTGKLMQRSDKNYFTPCTPLGCMKLIQRTGKL